jgi:predicted metal-dependent hydrolase/pimeloyl-ACP methyl ester carboxylesterase
VRVVASDGVTLAVTERGMIGAPVVVLVHGYPDSQRVWTRVADELAQRYRVVTYDVRGAGRSGAPRGVRGYRLAQLARDLEAVIDAVSPDAPVHLVGHDWGSIQSWEAVTEPAIARKLKSFTSLSGPSLDHVGHWLRSRPAAGAFARQALRSWYIGAMHGAAAVPSVWGGLIGRAMPRVLPAGVRDPELEQTRTRDGKNGIGLYVANVGPRLARPRLRTTEVPVQLVVATDDAYVTAPLADAVLPFASTVFRREVTGGHWGPFAAPAQTAQWIAELVEHVEGNPDLAFARLAVRRPPSIAPRRPRFEIADTELHWVAGDPQTTHTVNVLSLLLPAGERWFVRLFRQALPLVHDPRLRDELRGFIGQEANHAVAHDRVLDLFAAQGIDVTPYVQRIERLFDHKLADAPFGITLPAPLHRPWLVARIGLVAAIEHYTTVLGAWALEADALHAASTSPSMMELLRWHGAEEVEHRSVAFDVFTHVGGRYPLRMATMAVAISGLFYVWVRGVSFMMRSDPTQPPAATWGAFSRAGGQGLVPTWGELIAAFGRYLRLGHHPSQEHAPAVTADVLAQYPAVGTRRG